MGKTYYYRDEVNDDFTEIDIKPISLPADYQYYSVGKVGSFFSWVLLRLIATPIAFLFQKIVFGEKVVGREKLKEYRKSGYFLYGNHTRLAGDAFTPFLISFPKKAYIVVNPDAVSIPIVKHLVKWLGGLPTPSSLSHYRRFCSAVHRYVEEGSAIIIYPEAHIWKKYTKIRPFGDTSFSFPVAADKPCFSFTTTYQKRKFFGGVKTTVYIDGPFFPDRSLPKPERKRKLQQDIYDAMVERTKYSTYEVNRFIKIESEEAQDEHDHSSR